jgi:hypothetical protein
VNAKHLRGVLQNLSFVQLEFVQTFCTSIFDLGRTHCD